GASLLNSGEAGGEFTVVLEANCYGDWVEVSRENVSLSPGDTATVSLDWVVKGLEPGLYDARIRVLGENGEELAHDLKECAFVVEKRKLRNVDVRLIRRFLEKIDENLAKGNYSRAVGDIKTLVKRYELFSRLRGRCEEIRRIDPSDADFVTLVSDVYFEACALVERFKECFEELEEREEQTGLMGV
ncbi:hypothetical protein DRN94_004385, partial [archaeon]|nr:hypothetical protein [archaeon]